MSKKNRPPVPYHATVKQSDSIELPVQKSAEIESEQSSIQLLKLNPGDIVAIGIKLNHLDLTSEQENEFLKWKSKHLQSDYPGIKFLIFPIGKVELSVLRKQHAAN